MIKTPFFAHSKASSVNHRYYRPKQKHRSFIIL